MSLFVVSNLITNALIVDYYGLKVGVMSIENWNTVDKYMSKPWTKIFATCFGLILAQLYHNILEFRTLSEFDRTEYKFISWFQTNDLKVGMVFMICWCSLFAMLLCGFPAIDNTYLWSDA